MSTSIRGVDTITGATDAVSLSSNNLHVAQYVWDADTLSWIKQSQSASGGVASDVTVLNFPTTQQVAGNVVSAPQAVATYYDSVSSTTAYVGESAPGSATGAALWRIKKLTFESDGGVLTQYADGDALYNNVWDDRGMLTYI